RKPETRVAEVEAQLVTAHTHGLGRCSHVPDSNAWVGPGPHPGGTTGVSPTRCCPNEVPQRGARHLAIRRSSGPTGAGRRPEDEPPHPGEDLLGPVMPEILGQRDRGELLDGIRIV